MTDTRLSSAIHMLVLISEAEVPMSSEQIATSVGTNASHVRRQAGLLRRAGIIRSRRGATGFQLVPRPDELTLLAVYMAVCQSDRVEVFAVHPNPNDACIVGRHIRPVLGELFAGVDAVAMRQLAHTTLADVIASLRNEAASDEQGGPGVRQDEGRETVQDSEAKADARRGDQS